MAKIKIEHDFPGCIGCGACAAICPETWEMKESSMGEHKAYSKTEEVEEASLSLNKEAAESCPVAVIHLVDKTTGKRIS